MGIHEYAHANLLRVLGYSYTVQFYWFSGYVIPLQSVTVTLHLVVVSLSGGFLTAVINAIVYAYLDEETDFLERKALQYHYITQFIYALFETAYIFGYISFEHVCAFMTLINGILFIVQCCRVVWRGEECPC